MTMIAPVGAAPLHSRSAIDAVFKKVAWRLIPILFLAYVLNFVDRINIGYAQLQMKQELGFTDAVYGLGAGLFFIGYFAFEVPSNLMLEKLGARITILRIMLLWGMTSAATLFVSTPVQFYIARFFLGLFEAGFFPGIMLYLTYWFPTGHRARIVALFMTARQECATGRIGEINAHEVVVRDRTQLPERVAIVGRLIDPTVAVNPRFPKYAWMSRIVGNP